MGIIHPIGFFAPSSGIPNDYSLDIDRINNEHAYITDANQTGLEPTIAWTSEVYVTFNSLPSTYFYFMCKCPSTISTGWAFYLGYTDPNWFLRAAVGDGSLKYTSMNLGYTPSTNGTTWYHYAVSCYLSGGYWYMTYYSQGSQLGTQQSVAGSSVSGDTYAFSIGGRNDTPTNRSHDGLIDECRFWNTNRSGTEIGDNYNKSLVGNETNLQGYWRLENDLLDETSNDNDLTAYGTLTYSSETPF